VSLKEEVELLQRIPMFAQVEPAKLKLLAFTSARVAFEPGQILFNEGDMGDAAYLIVDGQADVIVNTTKGQVHVAVIGKNAFVGEIAILCDVPRTATVRAKGRLVTLRIAKDLFMRLTTEFPSMAIGIMRELAFRLEQNNRRLREVLAENEQLKKVSAAS
jgi:CRP/FNR family transcriptional regulator, cyclic AMP receptor protein